MRALAILLLVAWGQAWGTDRYATPTGGASSGTCPIGTPCTLTRAQTAAAAGDTVYLNIGTYTEGINTGAAGTSGSPITYECLGEAGDCKLNGYAAGTTDRVIQADQAWHVFNKIEIMVQTGPGNANTYGLFVSAANTTFRNGIIHFTGDEATMGTGNIAYCAQLRAATTFEGNDVYDCTYGVHVYGSAGGHASIVQDNDFTNMTIGDYQDSDCMAVNGAASYSFAGTIFRRNRCSGYRDDGIDFSNADDCVADDNEFSNPINDVVENSSCIKIGYEDSSGNVARRNSCSGLASTATNRNYGVVATGASNAVLDSNVFVGGYRCLDIAQRNAAGGANNTFRNNTCSGNIDSAAKVYSGATGTVLTNNIFEGATYDIEVASGLTATGTTNRLVNGTALISGTYNQTGDTNGAAGWIGGESPSSVGDVCLDSDSPLLGAGTYIGAYVTGYDNEDLGKPPAIGARGLCNGRRAVSSRRAVSERSAP